MAVAQGIKTQIKRVKQVALGTAGTSGSKLMRRVTLSLNKESDTYTSAELASHQQSTGATEGPSRINGALSGELSAGTYDLEFAALLRKDFAATAAITALSVTIAGSGPTYTITRSSGWWTDGVKNGDVIRLSVGTLNAANISKNLLIIALTQTVATVVPLNGVALVAEGPITGCTVTVIGRKTWVPTAGHTNDYFTWEKWYADLSRSEKFVDVKPASADVAIPATGISTVNFPMVGLSRVLGGSEILSSPTAESTSSVLAAVQGKISVNGVVTNVTGIQININGTTSTGEPEVGSNTLSDLQVGRVMVSGSFTAKFTAATLQTLRDDQTVVTLIGVLADSALATADFVTFVMPAVKIFTDSADDGEKEIIRTYNFTAQRDGTGAATTAASHATIISIQDSLAA
jgi:hypothetical protein